MADNYDLANNLFSNVTSNYVERNLHNIVRFLATSASDAVDIEKQTVAIRKYIDNVYHKSSKIKSYYFRDEPAQFYDFFVDLDVAIGDDKFEKVDYKKIVFIKDHLVISGNGGCGKSILMRHLFLSSLATGDKIPVFFEIRDINSSEGTLYENLCDYFIQNIDYQSSDSFERCLRQGKFLFLLDGFDEITYDKKEKIATELLSLVQKFSGCQFIVSSRPDNIFRNWHSFTNATVEPLSKKSALKLIDRLPYDNIIKTKFMEQLENELYASHRSFLSNPLLLSIMLLTYGQYAEIPSKLSLFYNQAFEALFQKHDAAKGIYRRKLKCNLDMQDFSRIFSAFSLQTYDKRMFRFSWTQALEITDKSQELVNVSTNSRNFLDDALQGVCLLIEDGMDLAYSHRSFQEYFVALFINRVKRSVKVKLIERYLKYLRADNVLNLLYEINPELVEELVILPQLNRMYKKIGCTDKVDLNGFAEYLKIYWDSFGVDEFGENRIPGIFGGHKDRETAIEIIVYFWFSETVNIRYESNKSQENTNKFLEKYHNKGNRTEWSTASVNVGDEVLKELSCVDSVFSLEELNMVLSAKKAIEARHRESEDTLEEIFGG